METNRPSDEHFAERELREHATELVTSDRDKIINRIVLGVAGALVVAALLGFALAPYLLLHHPLVLLALAPWPRHMILIAPEVGLLPFMIIGTLRAYSSCALGYVLGRRFGVTRVAMFEKHSVRSAHFFALFMRVFARAGHAILVIIPGPLSGGLAAISGMRGRVALPLMLVGQAGWVYVNYELGFALQAWTQPVMAFIGAHMWKATLVCTLGAIIYEWNRRRLVRARSNATNVRG